MPTAKELAEAAGKAAELIHGAATGAQYNPSPPSPPPPSINTTPPSTNSNTGSYSHHAPLPDGHPDKK